MPLRLFDLTIVSNRRRYISIVFFIFLLAGINFIGERYCTNSIRNNWESIRERQQREDVETVQQYWKQFSQSAHQQLELITADSIMLNGINRSDWSKSELFERLAVLTKPNYQLEVFDVKKNLLCWNGKEGIATDTSLMQSTLSSTIARGSLYSFFVVVHPMVSDSKVVGYAVCKRLIDVNYPINNRFIKADVFASSFTSQLRDEADLISNIIDANSIPAESFPVSLTDSNGKILAVVDIQRASLEDKLQEVSNLSNQISGALAIFLALLIAGMLHWRLSLLKNNKRNYWKKALLWTTLLWLCRYVLVWLNIPEIYYESSIVDPSVFASQLGGGIAKSIADVFISAVTLAITVILIVKAVLYSTHTDVSPERKQGRLSILWALTGTVSITGVLCILLRGYGAVIRSAVFDSTLNYNDPMYFIPTLTIGVMLASLFILSLSLFVAGGTGIYICRRLWDSAFQAISKKTVWLIIVAGAVCTGIVFGIIHPSPLFTQWERFVFILAISILAALYIYEKNLGKRAMPFTLFTSMVFAVAAVIYPLDKTSHEMDHSYVETIASEISRPADGYIKLIVQQAVTELSSPANSAILERGDSVEIEKLAFKAWAKSILGKEGFNCAVTYFTTGGAIASKFSLDVNHTWAPGAGDTSYSVQDIVQEERRIGNHTMTIYRSASKLSAIDGHIIGTVGVEMSAAKQSVFGGDAPDILRNYTNEEAEARYRLIILSEYTNGVLTYSSSENFPVGNPLPSEEQKKAHSGNYWVKEQVQGNDYETYISLTSTNANNNSGIALSVPALDFRWHLFIMMRLIFFYIIISAAAGLITILFMMRKRKTPFLSFRSKLLLAFLIVAFVPMAIFAYYNRAYSQERTEQATGERLKRETGVIVSALQRQWGIDTPFDLATLSDQDAIHIANDVDIAFSIFAPVYEQISSEPEVFQAELFDRRLENEAYRQCVLHENNFYSNVQSIGTLQYVVGYKPLYSEAGAAIGVVAIPTLFRHREIDERLMQRNAYLFAAFAVAMLVALGVGVVFSNQISSPVRRLHEATRRIGKGEFDFQFRSHRKDEFGELEKAFEKMLGDLQAIQGEMMRAQRELAWKEMAKQVAHEIKNPLTPMKLSIQHLRQAYEDNTPEFKQLLAQVSETLLEQINTLSRIASEFSQFARMPEQKPEPCDIHSLLRDVTTLFGEYTDIIVHLQFVSNSPIIIADKEELRRAFVNILRNAVQAMNEHGSIVIATKYNGILMTIDITDSGQGIPAEIRSRLFEPNFSTKTDGMGLGLPIVKQIINSYGGSISIHSEVGRGTTVSILLPASIAV